jgi:hypothetical protein
MPGQGWDVVDVDLGEVDGRVAVDVLITAAGLKIVGRPGTPLAGFETHIELARGLILPQIEAACVAWLRSKPDT